tara:strand:+ start:42 stop:470 length:429 start_codon:yes stop_codon:yes gene_type:complete
MNERQFIVLKRNEGKTFKEIADTLNIINNKKYSSHFIGNIYRDEITSKRGEKIENSKIKMEINLLKEEFNEFLEMVGEQYRTVNWAVKAIKGDRHYSCTCGTTFLRDIITKEGSQHFAYRKCMICERQIKWLSQDQVEYPKL